MNDSIGLENSEDISLSVRAENSNITNLTDKANLFVENKVEITYENTREYWKNHGQENINLLNNESPHLVNVYSNIVAEYPELQKVKLSNENIQRNAYFSHNSLINGQYIPEISFNFDNQETYTDSRLEFLLRQVAIQLGAKYEDIKENKKLVTTFVFLHEFGHARDFFDNYLKPKENRGVKPLAEVLNKAGKEFNVHRLQDIMTLPVPYHINFSREDKKKYTKRLETYGIKLNKNGEIDREQLKIVRDIAYREMSSEFIADSFASNYIMKHRDEYFLPLWKQDDLSGRIKTGEEIIMNDKDIILSGIRDGKSITIKKIPQNGRSHGYSVTGFLDGLLVLGEGMRLIEDIDDPRYFQTSPIKWMNRRLLADGKTLFVARTVDGVTYEFIRNLGTKPKVKLKSIEEMNKALDIKEGSEVIIMKRAKIEGEESSVMIGETMMGRLKTLPKLYKAIELVDDKENFVGNTSPLIEARKCWRSWRIRTFSGSSYEIIPTE